MWFNKDTIAQTFNSYTLFHCKGYTLSDTFYRIEIELLVFKLCPVFILCSHFSSWALAANQSATVNHLKCWPLEYVHMPALKQHFAILHSFQLEAIPKTDDNLNHKVWLSAGQDQDEQKTIDHCFNNMPLFLLTFLLFLTYFLSGNNIHFRGGPPFNRKTVLINLTQLKK